MADNYRILDGLRAFRDFAATEIASVLYPKHIIAGPDGTAQDLLAALQDLAPASDVDAVTPSDSTVLTGVRTVYVGTGGDLVVTINGHDRTIPNVPDGSMLPMKPSKIKVATTASDIVVFK
jgi:hypothetical protein